MNYLSVCSGIEAATVAWDPLDWNPVGFGEIEPFPAAVLKHHYPEVPNFGDMTKFKEWDTNGSIELLVGGTPCQSFSVAGLRKGLDDPRGNLALVYCGMLEHFRPRWFVWENVPGVLSSNGGRDFGSFLGALAELGYGFAYRVLDAQFFGVAQRRRRVFVVGHLGSWQRAAAVLFERESLRRDTPPRREAGQEAARSAAFSAGNSSNARSIGYIEEGTPQNGGNGDGFTEGGPMYTLNATGVHGVAHPIGTDIYNLRTTGDLACTLSTNGSSQTGSGPTVLQSMAVRRLTKTDQHGVAHPISFDLAQITSATNRTRAEPGLPASTISKGSRMHVAQQMAVRRLTPVECERLQGFPDNYTNIPWRKSDQSPDGPRYKALGNSMAVPVMKWIGQRIQQVNEIIEIPDWMKPLC